MPSFKLATSIESKICKKVMFRSNNTLLIDDFVNGERAPPPPTCIQIDRQSVRHFENGGSAHDPFCILAPQSVRARPSFTKSSMISFCNRYNPILQTGRAVWAYLGLRVISAVQTLDQTHGKNHAFYHMPGWLILAGQVQTPYHARVLKNACKQVMSFAQRLKSMTTLKVLDF